MEFEPRKLINGSMLRQFAGQNISIMLKLEDEMGQTVNATSTDNLKIQAHLNEPLNGRQGDWVEIIGRPAGSSAVRATEAILFSGDKNFDSESYDMMVQFLNHCKDIYKRG